MRFQNAWEEAGSFECWPRKLSTVLLPEPRPPMNVLKNGLSSYVAAVPAKQNASSLSFPSFCFKRSVAFAGMSKVIDAMAFVGRSEEHTSELQSRENLVCRLLLEKKKTGCGCRS